MEKRVESHQNLEGIEVAMKEYFGANYLEVQKKMDEKVKGMKEKQFSNPSQEVTMIKPLKSSKVKVPPEVKELPYAKHEVEKGVETHCWEEDI